MNDIKLFLQLANRGRHIYVPRQLRRSLPQLSTFMSTNVSISQLGGNKETFQDVLPGIIDSLVSNPKFAQVPEVGSWIKQVLDYNLAGGKKTRGLTTIFAYEMLEKPENITDETLRLARTLGWCVEMKMTMYGLLQDVDDNDDGISSSSSASKTKNGNYLQAYFLVVDDMMDGSSTRRGLPCWYRMPNVGLGAINDSILIYCSIYETLRDNFSKSPLYLHLLELFNETLLYTSMGQHLDYTMAHRTKNDYSLFTIDRYYSIVKHKTSYYTFNLPVSLGLLLSNNVHKQTHEEVREICFELGRLFQIQDDYIDCFGDESITGKAGTDIQEGKCSWLAVNAFQRCNEAQRALFVECYGSKDSNHVAKIKQLYKELKIPEVFSQEESAIYGTIVKKANALPSNTSPALFIKLIDMMYKRKQ